MKYYSEDTVKELLSLKEYNIDNPSNTILIDLNDYPSIEYPFTNYPKFDSVPDACKHCSNHPSNGGSGICHCILGLPKITY